MTTRPAPPPRTLTVMSTAELSELNSIARERGYNRQLSDELIASLDPAGTHVVGVTLLHEHAAGVPVAPHVRAHVYCKVAKTWDPVPVFIDCDQVKFAALGTVTL